MQQFLSNGGLSKMLWIILMFTAGLGSLVMLFIEIANNQPPNAYVLSIISGVLTHGATVGGHILGKSAPEAPHAPAITTTGALPNVP